MQQDRSLLNAEGVELLFEGDLPSYHLRSLRLEGKVLHDITVTGPISLAQRFPLYRKTVGINGPGQFFCILDNRAGHENRFSFDDIQKLDSYLLENGITEFYGVTVTRDDAYPAIVGVARANMEGRGLTGELHATTRRGEAEGFILEKMRRSD